MKFSVFVVTLNSGSELADTLASILAQENADFEIIIKDGLSTDGSLSLIPTDPRIRTISQKDSGIYNGMNQVIDYATGDFGIFMNCGDSFHNTSVLYKLEKEIEKSGFKNRDVIFYGDCFFESRGYCIHYPDEFDDYVCFTTTLCHQATVYAMALLRERKFQEKYRHAADFEYYVQAYKNGTPIVHLPVIIANYKGNGVSEVNAANRKKTLSEFKDAMKQHFSKADYRKVWCKAQLHGVGIKRFLIQQDFFYPVYRTFARVYYKIKNQQ